MQVQTPFTTPGNTGIPTMQLITPRQAAARLTVSGSTIERMIRRGDLPLYRVGRGGPRRIKVQDVDRMLIPEQTQDEQDDLNSFITAQLKEG